MRTPDVVIVVLIAALLGLAALTGSGGGSSAARPRTAAVETPAPVSVIAKRVEALRALRFKQIPVPLAVTPAQAQREGLTDFDRSYPVARRHADEEVLKLLDLIAPDVSLRDTTASTFSQGVAGYYDPRTRRLRTVSGAATGTRVLAEMVLAHELTHALEDQRFGLHPSEGSSDDAALAQLALIEGSATALMYKYVRRWFTSEQTLGGLLGEAFADTGSLPAFLESELTFPYVGGEAFVADLLQRAGGRWNLVDLADSVRPPASTEQVMHPDRYIRVDPPKPVRLQEARVLGAGWRRAAGGTWGEFQTRELLAAAGASGAAEAAAGWGGDRYELWQRPAPGCAVPCAADDVLVMRWVWDT
ncbi:MAG: hypothetical protein QOE28_127, partial [Solirubrobacteraceae bacterium]|nr:hypothetical protein [Solirubrobacteraceae bacterium]